MSKEIKEPIAMRKMTVKEICGMNRATSPEDTKAYFRKLADENAEIAAIMGEVDGCGGKATQFGEALFLTGQFAAVNRITGQTFTASKLYLPKDAAETIAGKWKNRQNPDDVVSFKLMVSVVKDSASAVGYAFVCSGLKSEAQLDAQRAMLSELAGLPAPKQLKQIGGRK